MMKYYTRACNFFFGQISKEKVNKKSSIPLNGNNLISFDTVELISRKNSKFVKIKDIKKLPEKLKKKIYKDLKIITKPKKIKKIKFKSYPILMGVLNSTPDSFSDGGKYLNSKNANTQIKKLINDGASIIDIGGESTRPNSDTVNSKVEWERIKSKIKYAKKNKIFVSLDTRKSYVLEKSLPLKIDLLNDVSGLEYDYKIIKILKKSKIPFVLHHMQGTPKTMQKNPKYKNVLLDIYDFFEEKLKSIKANKINHKNIILDPGIGFGKNLKHNITLINKISIFHTLGFPVMLGISKKRFIKDISGNNDSNERIGGTTSSSIYAYLQGVQILRVHDVNEIKQAMKVFTKIILNK
ncbi:dihydropteroate synthase [Candidatus Pelagibacter sp.]|nr:dihydropteroate synthase [Candidatus Pelagibacter sp.]